MIMMRAKGRPGMGAWRGASKSRPPGAPCSRTCPPPAPRRCASSCSAALAVEAWQTLRGGHVGRSVLRALFRPALSLQWRQQQLLSIKQANRLSVAAARLEM
jgi:hypothetical protein